MRQLTEESSYEDLKEYLLFHMEKADERKAKINPSITKKDVWNILMGAAMEASNRVRIISMKHAIKEFGSYFESSEEDI